MGYSTRSILFFTPFLLSLVYGVFLWKGFLNKTLLDFYSEYTKYWMLFLTYSLAILTGQLISATIMINLFYLFFAGPPQPLLPGFKVLIYSLMALFSFILPIVASYLVVGKYSRNEISLEAHVKLILSFFAILGLFVTRGFENLQKLISNEILLAGRSLRFTVVIYLFFGITLLALEKFQ